MIGELTDADECIILRNIGACECCQSIEGVELRSSLTACYFEGPAGADDYPNRQWMGCDTCWDEYREHWSAMWDDYHAGLL